MLNNIIQILITIYIHTYVYIYNFFLFLYISVVIYGIRFTNSHLNLIIRKEIN